MRCIFKQLSARRWLYLRLTLLKSSMSSSWSELVGEAVADSGFSGDCGR